MNPKNRIPAEAMPKNSVYKIKPIPTYYSGVKFRSHLEASYAFFFDEYEIKWQYEVEGYDLDGLWYLPDFWLPELKTFFEVKGVLENIEKPRKLAEALEGNCWGFPEILVIIGDSYGKVLARYIRIALFLWQNVQTAENIGFILMKESGSVEHVRNMRATIIYATSIVTTMCAV